MPGKAKMLWWLPLLGQVVSWPFQIREDGVKLLVARAKEESVVNPGHGDDPMANTHFWVIVGGLESNLCKAFPEMFAPQGGDSLRPHRLLLSLRQTLAESRPDLPRNIFGTETQMSLSTLAWANALAKSTCLVLHPS